MKKVWMKLKAMVRTRKAKEVWVMTYEEHYEIFTVGVFDSKKAALMWIEKTTDFDEVDKKQLRIEKFPLFTEKNI